MNFGNRRMNQQNQSYFDNEDYNDDYYNELGYGGGYGNMSDGWYGGGSRNNRGGWGGSDGSWGQPSNFGNMGQSSYAWGRGFGPAGPPVRNNGPRNAVIRFLMSCGLTREHLRKLPNDLLKLIQPDACGLCNVLLDNFHLSRSHYNSKLHFKNEQKWLYPQGPEPAFHRKQEVPMKSRDLYCELCDVHITSKSHADSHYSGKPHRAIVEGRKNPKNTILLQKHMAGRLDQLIRREKKHLKALPEIEKEETAVVQEKVTLPELYCEICKAPVTCSEQMTIHLNGKRHLAKEKRHILNMMQGKTKADTQQEDGEGNQEDDEEMAEGGDETKEVEAATADVETENKNEAEGGDQYDWENGSGTW